MTNRTWMVQNHIPRHQRDQRAVDFFRGRVLHPWLRINRVLRVMLHSRWSAEA